MDVVKELRFKCRNCGRLTVRSGSDIGAGLYCSPECYQESRAGRTVVRFTCPTCGKQFERYASRVKGKKAIYCSRECINKDGALRRLTPPPAEELERLYDEVRTVEAVARHLDVSVSTARKWVIVGLGLVPHHLRSTRRQASNGYIWIKVGPNDQRMEHRVVMERELGRLLLPTETVHHVNGDKADNRPENLELRHGYHGTGVRLSDVPHCPSCTCRLEQMKT